MKPFVDSVLRLLYGSPRRWLWLGLLVVVLVALRLTGHLA